MSHTHAYGGSAIRRYFGIELDWAPIYVVSVTIQLYLPIASCSLYFLSGHIFHEEVRYFELLKYGKGHSPLFAVTLVDHGVWWR